MTVRSPETTQHLQNPKTQFIFFFFNWGQETERLTTFIIRAWECYKVCICKQKRHVPCDIQVSIAIRERGVWKADSSSYQQKGVSASSPQTDETSSGNKRTDPCPRCTSFSVVTSAISPFFPSLSLPQFLKSGSLPSQYLSNKLLTPQNTSHSTSIHVTCSSEFYAEPTENRRVNAKGHYTTI